MEPAHATGYGDEESQEEQHDDRCDAFFARGAARALRTRTFLPAFRLIEVFHGSQRIVVLARCGRYPSSGSSFRMNRTDHPFGGWRLSARARTIWDREGSCMLELGIIAMSIVFFYVIDRYAIGCERL